MGAETRHLQQDKSSVVTANITQNLGVMVAGITYTGFLNTHPILDANWNDIGGLTSSFSATGGVFLVEKLKEAQVLVNGDYFIDYRTGYFRVKAGASATPVASWYVKIKNSVTLVQSQINDPATGNWGNSTPEYTRVLDYDASSNLIFFGAAVIGSLKSNAVWQIRKLIYDVSSNLIDIQWAGGNSSFDDVWNDRVSLVYS